MSPRMLTLELRVQCVVYSLKQLDPPHAKSLMLTTPPIIDLPLILVGCRLSQSDTLLCHTFPLTM